MLGLGFEDYQASKKSLRTARVRKRARPGDAADSHSWEDCQESPTDIPKRLRLRGMKNARLSNYATSGNTGLNAKVETGLAVLIAPGNAPRSSGVTECVVIIFFPLAALVRIVSSKGGG